MSCPSVAPNFFDVVCVQARGHAGEHVSLEGITWENHFEEIQHVYLTETGRHIDAGALVYFTSEAENGRPIEEIREIIRKAAA